MSKMKSKEWCKEQENKSMRERHSGTKVRIIERICVEGQAGWLNKIGVEPRKIKRNCFT